jgi:hydroxyacyl-ACP dehydratase HTD2-like protein with hotdog domain
LSAGDAARPDPFDGSAWIGRETRQRLRATRDTVECFEATLDRPVPASGDALAPLRHWLWVFAPPATATAGLAADGHPPRGELVPDWPLPRRMWAGSDVRFHEPVPLDAPLERVVTVESASVKHGRSGTLGFVVLRHRWLLDGRCAIDDAQTVVYREPVGPVAPGEAAAQAPATPPATPPAPGAWRVEHRPSEVLLFRYSALTFNSHRIHYDAAYTRDVEGYPGLVVQGPLMATLMLDAFRDAHPRACVRRFTFRALQPAFAGQAIACGGVPDGEGRSRLWVRDAQGREHVAGEVLHD